MRALSIRQPWAFAILELGKDVENRGWSFSAYRGPVLIHAAKGCTRAEDEGARGFMRRIVSRQPPPLSKLPRGEIVGIARITGADIKHPSCWAVPGALHLSIADVRSLPSVRYTGMLGFFGVDPVLLGEHAATYQAAWDELVAKGGAS